MKMKMTMTMKKVSLIIAAVSCLTIVFNACQPSVNYPTTYMYQVKQDNSLLCYDMTEAATIQSDFDRAIGYDGYMYKAYQSQQDELMKAACEEVQKKYADAKSVYLKFDLYRTALTAEPGVENKVDLLSSYEMGQALSQPYMVYSVATNEDEAYPALEALKSTLEEKVYQASYRTLLRLLGIHKSSTSSSETGTSSSSFTHHSVFDNHFKNEFSRVWPDDANYDAYVAYACDSIAAAHATDTLAVQAVVKVYKTGLLNKEATQLWGKTFEPNVK